MPDHPDQQCCMTNTCKPPQKESKKIKNIRREDFKLLEEEKGFHLIL